MQDAGVDGARRDRGSTNNTSSHGNESDQASTLPGSVKPDADIQEYSDAQTDPSGATDEDNNRSVKQGTNKSVKDNTDAELESTSEPVLEQANTLVSPYKLVMFNPLTEYKTMLTSSTAITIFGLTFALWAIAGGWWVFLAVCTFAFFLAGLELGAEQQKGGTTRGVTLGLNSADLFGKAADASNQLAGIHHLGGESGGVLNVNSANIRHVRSHLPLCIDPELDDLIQRCISLVLRDFLLSWFGKLTSDGSFVEEVRACFETMAMKIEGLVVNSTQDIPTFVTSRMMHAMVAHLRAYREMESSSMSSELYFQTPKGQAYLHFAARSPKNERQYLKQLGELMAAQYLPPEEFGSNCTRALVREMLVAQCLAPTINTCTDGDFVNRQILAWFPPKEFADRMNNRDKGVKLSVKVCQMRNFVPRKEGQISEPFCTIRYDGEPVSTSKIAYREVPIWNERFTFMVHKPVEADPWDRAYKEKTQQPPFNSRDLLHPLHIRVFDYDLFRGEVFLGTVIVPLDTLPANNTRADWYTLLTPTGGAASGAQNMALRLELSLVMNESDAKTWSRVTLERAEIKKRSEGGGGMVTTPKAGRAQPDNLGSSSTHTSPIVGERDRFRSQLGASATLTDLSTPPERRKSHLTNSVGASDSNSPGSAARRGSATHGSNRHSFSSMDRTPTAKRMAQNRDSHGRTTSFGGNNQDNPRRTPTSPHRLTFDEILQAPASFLHFMEFMEQERAASLLQFWVNANNYRNYSESADEQKKVGAGADSKVAREADDFMRLAKQKQQLHQQQQLEAFSIFTMHFSSGAPFPVPVPQDIIKKMEASLKDSILGPAPLVFEEAQASVYRLMRREYYPRFRHSLIYRKFLESRDDGSTVGQTIDARDIPYTHSRTPSGAIKVQDTTNNTTNDPNTTRDDIVDTIDTVTEVEEEVREAAINANLSVASEVKYSQPMDISGQSIQSHSSIHSEKSVGADVEEPEANHGSPTSQSEGHNAIGAAIALMKEQQLIVEDLIIASVPGSKQYKTLINQQEAIGFELAQLMAMGLMNQDEEVMEGMTVDVGSVDVEAQGDNLGKVVYLIEVAQYSGTKFLSGWMLTKDYDDVEELYAKLSLHFAKVKQIPFPVCPKKDMFGRPGNVGSSLTLNKQGVLRKREEKKEQHRKAINSVLNMFLLDELLYRSKPVQDFLKPDNVNERRAELARLEQIKIAAKSNMAKLREQQNELSKRKKSDMALQGASTASPLEVFFKSESNKPPKTSPATDHPPQSKLSTDSNSKPSAQSQPGSATSTPRTSHLDPHGSPPNGAYRKSSQQTPLQPPQKEDGSMWTDIMFALIDEIFELNSRNKWLRRKAVSVMTGVLHSVHGASINKTIQENVNQLFSLQQLKYCITVLRESFWPNGILAPTHVRTPQEIDDTRNAAQEAMMATIPDVVEGMVGRYNCTMGFTKVFNTLQNKQMNKHLAYVLVDTMILAVLGHQQDAPAHSQQR